MSDYIGVVTNAGQAKIAAAIGGTAVNLTTIRVGDGNGAPITPNPAMTDLVRRVGAAYPIISSGRDPINANHWRVTALIPVADGPFDVREIGVWDAAGEMIAVARHVLVEKRTPAQGAAVELLTDIVFPVSETAQITVEVTPAAQISIFQMLRAGFCCVESTTVANPPGAPALGRTHVVPAGATGAWLGLAGALVQWNGIVWVAVTPPEGHIVVDNSKALDDATRWMRKTAAGWVSAGASETGYGVTRHATIAETRAGVSNILSVTPAGLRAAVRIRLSANLILWVRTDGNDANDGSANTPQSAMKTILAAYLRATQQYDTAGYSILIRLGNAGAYTGALLGAFSGGVVIEGDQLNPAAYLIRGQDTVDTCIVTSTNSLTLRGLTLNPLLTLGGASNCLFARSGSVVNLRNVDFKSGFYSAAHSQIGIEAGASVYTFGAIGIRTAGGSSFIDVSDGGSFQGGFSGDATTVTLYDNPGWSTAFCRVRGGGAKFGATTFSGAATGKRFDVSLGGRIDVQGQGDNFLPGNAAGTRATGGQHD